jgi:hypothetical protein
MTSPGLIHRLASGGTENPVARRERRADGSSKTRRHARRSGRPVQTSPWRLPHFILGYSQCQSSPDLSRPASFRSLSAPLTRARCHYSNSDLPDRTSIRFRQRDSTGFRRLHGVLDDLRKFRECFHRSRPVTHRARRKKIRTEAHIGAIIFAPSNEHQILVLRFHC